MILKVKRNFFDPYLWVLAKNNEVYRVNSQTLVIDDYTSKFKNYNNFQFVDITGRSQDTVFIASNSSNVIQYKNGNTRLIGSVDGISGTVNSVGMVGGGTDGLQQSATILMIATDNGFLLYDTDAEKFTGQPDNGNSRIYEASYRTTSYKDSSAQSSDYYDTDTVQYQPFVYLPGDQSRVTGYLWEGGKQFGYNIKTAIPVYESLIVYNTVFTNLFWGDNNGLSQNFSNYSNDSHRETAGHYLDGISVNKVATIYGLNAFDSGLSYSYAGIMKQNLLIGTDQGLYFSSNIYTSKPANLRTFALFHDGELGKLIINDICVNEANGYPVFCEDGIWLGAVDGLYLLKPDYGKYLGSQQADAIFFKNQSTEIDYANICSGNSITAIINQYAYGGKSIQWYKDGQEIPAASADTLFINTTGNYNAVLFDPCSGIHLESNHLQVNVITAPVFSFNYPDKLQYCDVTSTTLQTDYNSNYQYRWYTNGVLNGGTSNSYTVTQNGKYKVEVSACASSWTPSKEIEVDLVNLPLPQITADKAIYCQGDVAHLQLNVAVDPSYTINWYQDGNLIAGQNNAMLQVTTNGNYTATLVSTIGPCSKSAAAHSIAFISSPSFTFDYPDVLNYCDGTPVTLQPQGDPAYHYRWYLNGVLTGDNTMALNITQSGSYHVEVSACEGSWVPSKIVQVNFIKLPVPVIQTDKPVYCIGDNASLSVSVPVSNAYTINWYQDNNLLSAQQNRTSLITNVAGSYSVKIISSIVTCEQVSAIQPLTLNPEPTVSIAQTVLTTLCSGQPVQLQVGYTGGTIQWSTGETTAQITVNKSGTYKATVTSAAGCVADADVNLQLFPLPVFTLRDTSVCTYTRQSVTLTAPAGYSSYSWNDGEGTGASFLVTTPQTVSLTVTDSNGCQATQQVTVSAQCPDVHFPNTFTPNGDGINDSWDIAGLENDPTAMISVYNRYGSLVYQSRGYNTPWNGSYQGKKLPAAVYYYIISAKNGKQTFSGSVTILY